MAILGFDTTQVKPLLFFCYVMVITFPFAVYAILRVVVLLFIPRRFRYLKDLTGKTVLITGAGSGIGRQMAIEFSKHSSCLVLLDLNPQPLMDTQKLLVPGARSFVYVCDVTNRDKVYRVAEDIRQDVGHVDVLVNNAGSVNGGRFLDLEDDRIVKIVELNMLAHYWMCKAFLPEMMSGNSGHVVCIASMAGLQGFPRMADYSGSKFGAVGFMEALGLECQRHKVDGVKFTTVCPSFATTGLFEGMSPPLKVNMSPEYVAKKVVEAVEEEKDLVMIPSWTYIIILLKWTMPSYVVKRFFENSGLLTFMDDFKGRISNNNVKVATSSDIQ